LEQSSIEHGEQAWIGNSKQLPVYGKEATGQISRLKDTRGSEKNRRFDEGPKDS